MQAPEFRWDEVGEDHPIPLLHRKRIQTENILLARVRLDKGCVVPQHSHESEQIAMHVSGRALWTIGEGDAAYEREVGGGEVLVLPSNVKHALRVLEDTEIIDILSPPGPMGVDAQTR